MRRHVFISLLVTALSCSSSPALARQTAPQSTPTPTPAGGQSTNLLPRFVITLALGDVQAGPWSEFTPGAKKALDDLNGFLPYKTYKLLDTVYRIGVNGPVFNLTGFDRMYVLNMAGEMTSATATRIRLFRLTDTQAGPGVTGLLIDTAFNIELGETVVVGTSRLGPSRALLVLVTAMR